MLNTDYNGISIPFWLKSPVDEDGSVDIRLLQGVEEDGEEL